MQSRQARQRDLRRVLALATQALRGVEKTINSLQAWRRRIQARKTSLLGPEDGLKLLDLTRDIEAAWINFAKAASTAASLFES